MNNLKSQRKSCKDVFNAFLTKNARYAGIFEFPIINPISDIPQRLISFSKAISEKNDFAQWIHFFEYDCSFERLWRNPNKYLSIFKKFEGVILPDFSLYYDMPFAMQIWNIYRSRVIGNWLQNNQIKVIPNLRYGDKRSFNCCCEGISPKSIIAIGSYGLLKNDYERNIFIEGFKFILDKLQPSVIIIYGSIPSELNNSPLLDKTRIIQFDSETCKVHRRPR